LLQEERRRTVVNRRLRHRLMRRLTWELHQTLL